MDIDGAVRAMVGGRDYGAEPVQPRDRRAAPARLLVQALRLCRPRCTNGFKPTSIVVDAPICLGNWCPQNYSRSFSGSMTLTQALARSINIIPVRLSVALGDGNPKVGRAKIIEIAQRMGLRTPLPDSSSLPIGAAEVTVLDHTAGYATFPNGGKAVDAARDPRSAQRQRRGRSGASTATARSRVQVIRPQVAMRHEHHDEQGGRGRHRQARACSTASGPPARPAPPTPTATPGSSATPAITSRGVWFGNDDYAPTNRMTGGSLPGHDLAADHGLRASGHRAEADAGRRRRRRRRCRRSRPRRRASGANPAPQRPTLLTKRSIDVLLRVERMMETRDARARRPRPRPQRGAAGAAAPNARRGGRAGGPRGN